MGMQSDGYSNSGRGGMGSSGGGAYGGQGSRGGYSGRGGMQDDGDQMQQSYGGQQMQQQNYSNMQQGYGGFRGGASMVNGGSAGVRYPAGYGGTSAASGMNMSMNRGIAGPGQGGYLNPQMYAQQSQPMNFYGYGYR